jgi:Fur family transcriptional regulator, peroxide stress response regulator
MIEGGALQEPRLMEKRPTRTELRSQVDTFAAHCRANGLSVTSQRLAIFEALAASREHPSAEQIHKAVRRRIPTLSLATVYKNLEALRSIGAVADVNPLHEQGRYEAALPGTGAGRPHHHLVCVECKDVRDLHDPGLEGLQVSDLQGFELRALKVQVEGICPRCAGTIRVAR